MVMFDYFYKLLLFITLPIISALGPVYANLFFLSLYCLVLLVFFIKFKSAAVRISSVITLLVILTQQYYEAKIGLAFLPANELYYGVIVYVFSWLLITLILMIRAERFTPLQHRAKILYFIFFAIIAFGIYYSYSLIIKYVIERHSH